jgi:hypothetical protein
VKFRDLPSGDDSKFYDHYDGVGLEAAPAPADVGAFDADVLARGARYPTSFDSESLWRACPFASRP